MKNNISKFLLSTLITLGILFSINNVSAVTIKETVNSNDNYDTIVDGSIIIGITKFEPNVVLTGKRISIATYNDVMFKYGTPNYDGVDIYYYLLGDWYKLDEDNTPDVLEETDPMVEKLNNADVYYVNNSEKMLEIPYSKELDPGYEFVFKTNNAKKDKDVKYVDGKILLPATISNIDIYTKETTTKVEEKVDSFEKTNANDVVLEKTTYLDLSSSIEEKSNNLISTYYNKYSNGDLITNVNDDVYYVTLGEYVGSENPSELKIGGNTYDTSAKYLSIGNKAFVNVPVWKIKDGKVLVALTWLSADALPDKATTVEVGGQTFEVIVYSTSVANSTVTISGADGIFGPAGYASEATINGNTVDFRYTHGATALGLKLKVGEVEITEANKVIFRKATDGNMGLTTTESNGYTYAVYFNYANEAISEAKDYVKEYKLAIPGKGVISVTLNGHAVPVKVDLSSSIEEKSNNLISTYYNKYSKDQTLVNVNDDVYYVTLGEYVGNENPSELKIGNNTYDTSAKYLSIGNKAFVNVPVWKIKDGKVLVALTWLSADALPDKATTVEVGGQTFEVTVYSTSVEGSTVTISGASGIYGPAGYASEATINGNTVDFRYTHGATALGIKLKVGGVEITEANKVIFRKAADGNMGLTTTESNGYTYAVYFNYVNEAISEAKDYVYEYKLAIPGKGVISVTLNGHAVPVKVDLSSSIEEKSNNLIDTYYNKYSNGDLITNVNDDVYYVTLGEYVGSENPSELKVGGNTYDTSAKYLSIGNNAFVNAPVWKIKDGKVLVALTWLSADALPDKATTVEVGGQTFEVTIYSTSVEGSTVTISGADGIFGPAGYASEATINGNTVDFRYTHGAIALGLKLKVGGVEITEANKVIFRKATDGNMGLTTTESNGYTYAVYFNYANEAISEAKDYVKEYKLAIPGKGVISVTLNGHAVPSL